MGVARAVAVRAERRAPDVAGGIGDVGLNHLVRRVQYVRELIRGVVGLRLAHHPPHAVVLVREVDDAADLSR